MVKVILDEGLEHAGDCAELATGVPELRPLVAEADLDDLAARCEVPRERIEGVARDFAAATGAMAITRTGTPRPGGTIGEWLGHVLNVITGRMDRPAGDASKPVTSTPLQWSTMAKPMTHKSGSRAGAWWPVTTGSTNCPTRSPRRAMGRSGRW